MLVEQLGGVDEGNLSQHRWQAHKNSYSYYVWLLERFRKFESELAGLKNKKTDIGAEGGLYIDMKTVLANDQ